MLFIEVTSFFALGTQILYVYLFFIRYLIHTAIASTGSCTYVINFNIETFSMLKSEYYLLAVNLGFFILLF